MLQQYKEGEAAADDIEIAGIPKQAWEIIWKRYVLEPS